MEIIVAGHSRMSVNTQRKLPQDVIGAGYRDFHDVWHLAMDDDRNRFLLKADVGHLRLKGHPLQPRRLPLHFHEMLGLAEHYVEKFGTSQDFLDLYPAALSSVHVVDWFVEKEQGRKFIYPETLFYTMRFPGYRSLKDFANGLKHAVRGEPTDSSPRSLVTSQDFIEWEDPDAWEHAHEGDRPVWCFEHNGESRSIYVIASNFLREFLEFASPQLKPVVI